MAVPGRCISTQSLSNFSTDIKDGELYGVIRLGNDLINNFYESGLIKDHAVEANFG